LRPRTRFEINTRREESTLTACSFVPGFVACVLLARPSLGVGATQDPNQALRLVPFPKVVRVSPGRLRLQSPMTMTVSKSAMARQVAGDLRQELAALAGVNATLAGLPDGSSWGCCLAAGPAKPVASMKLPAQPEGYALSVAPDRASVAAKTERGLVHGIQTLRQLIRANTRDGAIPCLTVRDWPSLQWRGYSDDITRGPSPTLDVIKGELRTTSLLKMNFWTYYMEYQYAFTKHPTIGPKDGSLTPTELTAIVEYGKRYGVSIIGNQQSFGHFAHILKHDKYKPLRETPNVLNPTNEATYQLLDDLYSEVVPLLDSPFFNVCCDETWGLGTGPSKPLADKIGVGGVYANHLRRIHDLLKDKYGKRMMMWGDIIIRHPQHLPKIPKDTIVLSWGYHAAPSFDAAITPFAKSGYEFFVCPGVSCWSRILPDFGVAVTNIRNYVRDGAKHGALGMLNTTWDDDGENFFAPNWHGVAWGAECAWNASKTPYRDFSRRIGAVMFGEPGDHFGQAIDLLTKTHRLPGYDQMLDRRFWKADFGKMPVDERSARRRARSLLDITRPALKHLRTAKSQARVNADWLDYFIFGADRMQLMATRALGYLDAARAYEEAALSTQPTADGLKGVEATVRKIRDDHVDLKRRYIALWRRENKPYALDWVMPRFDAMIKRYDTILAGLEASARMLREKGALLPPDKVGLRLVELGVRRTRPAKVLSRALAGDAPWANAAFRQRIGLVLRSGDVARVDQPVEVDLSLPQGGSDIVSIIEVDASGRAPRPLVCQVQPAGKRKRLAFVAAGPTPKGGERRFMLYFDPAGPVDAPAQDQTVRCSDAPGEGKWIENDRYRLLVGPEGGHIYRWEIKALGGRDVTYPGKTGWAGFADLGGTHRSSKNRIEVLANGPAMVRLRCTDATDLVKTLTAYAGLPWIEVNLNGGVDYFWCFTDTRLMAADSPTPGTYLFADGATGKVRKLTSSTNCQVDRPKVQWAAKFVSGGPMIATITPEVATRHVVGPGGGMGGAGVERATPCSHFAIYAGKSPQSPRQTLDALRATLDYRTQPELDVYAIQKR